MKQIEIFQHELPEWLSAVMLILPDKFWLMMGAGIIERTDDEPPSPLVVLQERMDRLLQSLTLQADEARKNTKNLEEKLPK